MNEDFAYTKCISYNQSILYCDCNCHYCGKREGCQCELRSIETAPYALVFDKFYFHYKEMKK
ncbi:MAG: hypothetical protein OEM18_05220 [Nitrosopumilus sp.]|nr:hypothetical protein [Nitrosopumilus sp.]